jgi:hypothetical protein
MKKITREDAIRVFDRATDKDDPFWEMMMEEFIEESDDDDAPLPSPEDVLEVLGVSKEEYQKAVRRKQK